jgi:signal transduction histidine kinase
LRITDSGPGLDEDALANVGMPFFTTKPDGLGVGVAISKSIAEQHGGALSVTNAGNQGGAVVEVSLPVSPDGDAR